MKTNDLNKGEIVICKTKGGVVVYLSHNDNISGHIEVDFNRRYCLSLDESIKKWGNYIKPIPCLACFIICAAMPESILCPS